MKFSFWDLTYGYENSTNDFKFAPDDVLIHLAWPSLNNFDSINHLEHLDMHFKSLRILFNLGLKNLIVAGTCLEYGKREGEILPTDKKNPITNYAIAKCKLHDSLLELRKTLSFNLQWMRLFYIKDPDPIKKNLMYQLEYALKNNHKEFRMSNGNQLRDFVSLKDISSTVDILLSNKQQTREINCCSNNPISVKDLVLGYLKNNKKEINIHFGFYEIPYYEGFSFWGVSGLL